MKQPKQAPPAGVAAGEWRARDNSIKIAKLADEKRLRDVAREAEMLRIREDAAEAAVATQQRRRQDAADTALVAEE